MLNLKELLGPEVYKAVSAFPSAFALGKFREYVLDPNKPKVPPELLVLGRYFPSLSLAGGGSLRGEADYMGVPVPALDLFFERDITRAVFTPKAPALDSYPVMVNDRPYQTIQEAPGASLDTLKRHVQENQLVLGSRVKIGGYPEYRVGNVIQYRVGTALYHAANLEELKTLLLPGTYDVRDTSFPSRPSEPLVVPQKWKYRAWWSGRYGASGHTIATDSEDYATVRKALEAAGHHPYQNHDIVLEDDRGPRCQLILTPPRMDVKRTKVWWDGTYGAADKSVYIDIPADAKSADIYRNAKSALENKGLKPVSVRYDGKVFIQVEGVGGLHGA